MREVYRGAHFGAKPALSTQRKKQGWTERGVATVQSQQGPQPIPRGALELEPGASPLSQLGRELSLWIPTSTGLWV